MARGAGHARARAAGCVAACSSIFPLTRYTDLELPCVALFVSQVEATKSPKVPPKPCSHYESHELEIQCMYKLRDYLGEANADRLDSFCAALDRYHQACHPYRLEFTSPEQVASLKDFKLDVSDPSRDFYISHVAAARELMASTVV
eukprot:5078031-Pleurochrysis_carterae.AAC.4